MEAISYKANSSNGSLNQLHLFLFKVSRNVLHFEDKQEKKKEKKNLMGNDSNNYH